MTGCYQSPPSPIEISPPDDEFEAPPKGFKGFRVHTGKRPPLDVNELEMGLERKPSKLRLWLPMGAAENFRCSYEQFQMHGPGAGFPTMLPVAVEDPGPKMRSWGLASENRGEWVQEQKEDAIVTRLLSGNLKMGAFQAPCRIRWTGTPDPKGHLAGF